MTKSPLHQPVTPRERLSSTLHGVEVADPYRWLEDADSSQVQMWVGAQNAHTNAVLRRLPGREPIRRRLTKLLSAPSSVGCIAGGARVFSLERWGQHHQAVLVVRDALEPAPAVLLLDPVEIKGDITTSIDWFHVSPDGRLVAYGLSTHGDEDSVLGVIDAETRQVLPDVIPHTRAASVAWHPDGSGFAYTRFPSPGSVPEHDLNYWRTVYWHNLGDDWHHDELVWANLPDRAAWSNVSLSPDGSHLLIHQSIGWRRVDVHLIERATGAHTVMIEGLDAVSTFSIVDRSVIGLTTLDADRGRLVTAPLQSAWHENWETLVPEDDTAVIEAFAITKASLLVLSSERAVARLERYDHRGQDRTRVALPTAGSLAGLAASRHHDVGFFCFTSFAVPPLLLRWSPEGVESWTSPIDPNGDPVQVSPANDVPTAVTTGATVVAVEDYRVDQEWFPASDGAMVSMFIVRAAGTEMTPDTPVVLTAYGGFAISMTPTYSAAVVAVCDLGGAYVIANIRGGAEHGDTWHRAGTRANKQRCFDDFIEAADWLVTTGRTSRERLAIRGGSNGGLLVGAAMTQRPDLCRAVHCAVPLLDMVRYHRFSIARLWIPEYGDPDIAEEFSWLYAYSPYHHVDAETCYPATLITTADGDARVDPSHARKMAAQLQWATSCAAEKPVLLRTEQEAGHGPGKPLSMQVDDLADVLAFLGWQLGIEVPARLTE